MGGGVIVGTLWGIFVAAFVLAAVSLSTPLPPRPDAVPTVMDTATDEIAQPEADLPEPSDPVPLPEGSGFNRLPPTDSVVLPDSDAPVAGDGPSDVAAGGGDSAFDDRSGSGFVSAPEPSASVSTPPTAPIPSPTTTLDLPQVSSADGARADAAPDALLPQDASDAPALVDPDTPPAPVEPQTTETVEPTSPAARGAEDPIEAEAASETVADQTPDATPSPEPQPLVPFGAVTAADLAPEGAEEGPAPFALRDHSVPFTEANGRPLMAIVLIDTPDTAPPLDVLTGLVVPVAFAVDPTRPDAAARAAAFREAGFEVVIHGSLLPEGATASDVEAALSGARQVLPEAVALLDTADSRIQGDRAVLDATVAALSETGHGLVAFPQGLNAAEQTARRVDLPATTLFRLLDDEDQRATVITRYLDRAEFAAAEGGGVVVAGHTRPDTITALLSWALSSRSEAVALAPLSAVLLEQADR